MEENLIKPIEEKTKENEKLEDTTNEKNITNDEIIKKLPEWNIEPPIEIRRGEK